MVEGLSLLIFVAVFGITALVHLSLNKNFFHPMKREINLFSMILFLFLWNSEYVAASILICGFIHLLQQKIGTEKLDIYFLLKNVLSILILSFVMRKLKDSVIQLLIEKNLQHIN